MKIGDVVKYSKPQPGEEVFRFVLLDNPEIHERVDIRLIDSRYRIAPVERVDLSEIAPADDVCPLCFQAKRENDSCPHGCVPMLTAADIIKREREGTADWPVRVSEAEHKTFPGGRW